MPTVSVVMPAYNAEKYICEAIDSILCQTYTDFEFIIINDCSTDRTEEIILSYCDSRIVYLKNERNLGVAMSLNRGLEIARGEFIARMDADDISMPQRLEKQIDFMMRKSNVAVLGSDIAIFNDKGTLQTGWSSDSPSRMKVDLFFSCGLAHPSVMMRHDVIKELGGYDPDYNGLEDYELWCRVIEKYDITTLPDVLLKYRIHESQVTKNPTAEYGERFRKLKMRQLSQLGIDPMCDTANAYYKFCEGAGLKTEKDISDLNSFFELAVDANKKCDFYDTEKLVSTFKSVLIQNAAKLPHRDIKEFSAKSSLIHYGDIVAHIMKQKIKKLIGKSR